jgi:hypothetical protein
MKMSDSSGPTASDPPWLEECRLAVFGRCDPRIAEMQTDAIRKVLAFAARQPRPITDTEVEAAARAVYRIQNSEMAEGWFAKVFAATEHEGDCTNQPHTCLLCEIEVARRDARAALEAAENARVTFL